MSELLSEDDAGVLFEKIEQIIVSLGLFLDQRCLEGGVFSFNIRKCGCTSCIRCGCPSLETSIREWVILAIQKGLPETLRSMGARCVDPVCNGLAFTLKQKFCSLQVQFNPAYEEYPPQYCHISLQSP